MTQLKPTVHLLASSRGPAQTFFAMHSASSIFKISIVHQNSDSGRQAVLLLKKLASRLEEQLGLRRDLWKMDSDIWKFDWLRDSELRERAAERTAEANMIVVAAADDDCLPQCVKDWLETALLKKENGPTAIVALLGEQKLARTRGTATSNAMPATFYLRELARLHGVDFFCNVATAESAEPPAPFEFSPGEDDAYFPMDALAAESRRGWGIND